MAKQFEFLFDVGAPNAYLVHKILPQFCTEHDAEVIYKPILLGGVFKATGNRAPMVRYADAPAKLAYEQLEFKRFLKAHGLATFRFNPHFPVNSLLAMRTIAGAQDTPEFAVTIDAMMRGMWEDGIDLAQTEAVIAALDNAGLDGSALVAGADDAATKAKLVAQTEAAVARGVFGVPTFFVGEDMFWGKERLGQVAEALNPQLFVTPA
jgi:2-hydroxychromene-2-carboxylate isomerase